MGKNDRGTKYNGLNLILRDADHIDKYIAMAENPVSSSVTDWHKDWGFNLAMHNIRDLVDNT